MMQFPCSYIVLALGQMVGCHSNWSLPSSQGVEKEFASFLRIFHTKIESIRFFLRVYILKVKFQGAVGSMFLDMWGKMGCREREWSLHDGDGESGAFPSRFQLFCSPAVVFRLYCLLKFSLYSNSWHIYHQYLLLRVEFVSLATKRILPKTKDFPEEVKSELEQ